ncbi:YbaK/EbsC family protein [Aeropyrum camini]|uniref:Uncharacterized conserved protein n=1 Tax=Aeropyrum camini SY1 = JCM 12091 TaxID=1198449 RepID=U3TF19_9CREN|nr:YbaK/EbsC family protein [Aeropyrum camini]BAN91061.1 uncharacterized conserved protein [Aeropyrum camini SY1 = JCM 12091]
MTGKVEEWIKARGLSWRLLEMPGSTRTVAEAARWVGVDESNIVKTLIALDSEGNAYAVIVPGGRRLSLRKLGWLVGKPVRLARPGEVLELTGYPVGGVPPVALPQGIVVVVDSSLLNRERVYGGGGSVNTLLEFNPKELVEAVGAVVGDVSE